MVICVHLFIEINEAVLIGAGFKKTRLKPLKYSGVFHHRDVYEYRGKKALPATNGGNGGCGGTGGGPGKVYLIGFADSKKFDVHSEPGK